MSSPYQILDNRPIDQWKVTELKEELKKRKLTTRGLKDDLVKRLDEAVRIERANAQNDTDNNLQSSLQPAVVVKTGETQAVLSDNFGGIVNDSGKKTEKVDNPPVHVDNDSGKKTEKVDNPPVHVDNDSGKKTEKVDNPPVYADFNDREAPFDQGSIQEGYVLVGKDSEVVEETLVVHTTTVDDSITVTESVVSDVTLREQYLPNNEILEEKGSSKPQLENVDSKAQLDSEHSRAQLDSEHSKPQVESDNSKPQVESDDLKTQLEINNTKSQLEIEYPKPTSEEVKLGVSAPKNQVSEVRPNLGSQVKYDSISTDSVSINEKIELKDNIIADNVKLELNVIKPEMVAPSSSTIVPASGDSHPTDVEEPHESNRSVEEKDDTNGTNADLSKKNDSLDVGYLEKLNLDRSSGDDSMEEDMLESKQIDSKSSSDDVGDRSEKTEVSDMKEEGHVDIVGDDFSVGRKDVHVEHKEHPSAPAEKRKLNGELLFIKLLDMLFAC